MRVTISYPATGRTHEVEWGADDVERVVDPEQHARFYAGEKLRAYGPATVVTIQLTDAS